MRELGYGYYNDPFRMRISEPPYLEFDSIDVLLKKQSRGKEQLTPDEKKRVLAYADNKRKATQRKKRK